MISLPELRAEVAKCDNLHDIERLILKCVLVLAQELMRIFLEELDDRMAAQRPANYKILNRQERTINFACGPVSFKRRYYQGDDGDQFFLLDRTIGIKPRDRHSAYLTLMMAKLARVMTMRSAAMALNLLFDSGVTHDTVMRAAHKLGEQVAEHTRQEEWKEEPRRVPENLTVEGDSFVIRRKPTKKKPARQIEAIHYRVYERVAGQLKNKHDFITVGSQAQARQRLEAYLDSHYVLQGQTVFLASDAGPGYSPTSMQELVPFPAQGEYFLDRYHCLRKLENTLGPQNELFPRARKALYTHDWPRLLAVLDTFESWDLSSTQVENLTRLRKYLERNWEYASSPAQRGFNVKPIGSIESSHRPFTYRMKKQGKSWSDRGAKAMLSLVEARMNGTLDDALTTSLRKLTKLPLMETECFDRVPYPVRTFMKKAPIRPSQGVIQGVIPVNAPTSSPIGRMARALTH